MFHRVGQNKFHWHPNENPAENFRNEQLKIPLDACSIEEKEDCLGFGQALDFLV